MSVSEATLNKVTLIGRVSKQPEVRQTPAGKTVASFVVVTNSDWRDRNGQRCTRSIAHRVIIYEQACASIAAKFLRAGSRVYVEAPTRAALALDPKKVGRIFGPRRWISAVPDWR